MRRQTTTFQLAAIGLASAMLVSACGGGGGSGGSSGSGGSAEGGMVQVMTFDFPGGPTVGIPPAVTTTKLSATATSGGPITYESNTPSVCTVSGTVATLLTAGECKVTAKQAGYQGYAPVQQSQIFVVPKNLQTIVFRNPGPQPLDSATLTLAATSSVAGKTVVFTTTTPTVCSVSGTSLSKLANGLCTVVGTQAGDDIWAAQAVTKNIPIGNQASPAIVFASGYKTTADFTKEFGAINGSAGANVNGWWCNGNCTNKVSADGSSYTFGLDIKLDKPADGSWIGGYWGMNVFAGGLTDLNKSGNTTTGARIDAQTALNITMAQNAEWIATGNAKVNVDMVLGHYVLKNGKDACNVTLRAQVNPARTTATAFAIRLKDQFTFSETCGLSGLDAWNEMQDYPISKLALSPDSMNVTVSSTGLAKPTYPTILTLSGPITFQ